jgi:putative membrane protein insertion efficiency factor
MLKWVLLKLIRGYQAVFSPIMPPMCRYEPSCSKYAYEAVDRHGAIRGGWLAMRRLVRCTPWGGKGYDPVPDR